jgi:N-formylglutamate amidohydrolase
MLRVYHVLIFQFFLFYLSFAQTNFIPGKSYFGQQNYIEYIAGNAPLIIAAPHGGTLKPNDIPDRNCDGCSYVMDANTQELARNIQIAVFQQWGCYPHIIVNRLHRIKLDANRDLAEAADGDSKAEAAWREFHSFIDTAKAAILQQYGKGLFIDLHGHGHAIQRLELGYLLTKSELQKPDNEINSNSILQYSSIKSLVKQNLQNASHVQLLKGTNALGSLLATQGYPAVPSLQDPAPLPAHDYFNGGYNTLRHGSSKGGKIDAIQIECNMNGVRDNALNRQKFADSLAKSIKRFLENYYFNPFPSCKTLSFAEQTNDLVSDIIIYPQPACQQLFLKTMLNIASEATIYSLDGIHIASSFLEENRIQIPDFLKDGSYLLQIKQKNKVIFFGIFQKKCL